MKLTNWLTDQLTKKIWLLFPWKPQVMANIKERISKGSFSKLPLTNRYSHKTPIYVYVKASIYIYTYARYATDIKPNRHKKLFQRSTLFLFWDSSKRGEVKLTTCISPQYGLAKDHTRHQARVRHFKKGWQHHTDPNAFSTGFGRAGTGLKGKRILEPTHPTLARSFGRVYT